MSKEHEMSRQTIKEYKMVSEKTSFARANDLGYESIADNVDTNQRCNDLSFKNMDSLKELADFEYQER